MLLLAGLTFALFASAADFANPARQWTRIRGSTGFDAGVAVVADPMGVGAYVAGMAGGAFDGESYAGAGDLVVLKIDNAGNTLWTRIWGSTAADQARAVASSSAGGTIYAGGYTAGAFDSQTNFGGEDLCLSKFNPGGARLWSRIWGSGNNDECRGVFVDFTDHPYAAGFTDGAFDGQTNQGARDACVSKYDGGGNRIWTRLWGSSSTDEAHAVYVDVGGEVYVAGATWGAFDAETNQGGADLFLTKFDPAGNRLWSRVWGSPADDQAMGVTIDVAGGIYVAGVTYGAFDGQTNQGGADLCLTRFDPAGNRLWSRIWGSPTDDDALSVAMGGLGNVFVAGSTYGAYDGQTNMGSADQCLSCFDVVGNRLWSRIWGSSGIDEAGGVAADTYGNPFVAGYTDGAFDGQGNAGVTDICASRWLNVGPPPEMSLVPGVGQPGGPAYDFQIGRFEVRNDQFARFLNDAMTNQWNERGTNMYFSPAGDVFMDAAALPAEKLFSIGNMTAGSQFGILFTNGAYQAYPGKSDHPVYGVSWYGAVKYCNWLTIDMGLGTTNRCYAEGQDPAAWQPVTATGWPIFTDIERQALIDGYHGFRLPMDHYMGVEDPYNEFYKAAAWNVEFNTDFGFGRNTIGPEDANYEAELWPSKTTPVGYYNGVNPTLATNLTQDTANMFGLYDMSGNVAEWSSDTLFPDDPGTRSVRGGDWSASIPGLACYSAYGIAPETTDDMTGFRVARTVAVSTNTMFTVVVDGVPAQYGFPWPFVYGTNLVADGTTETNTIDPIVPVDNGIRAVCTGWELADSLGLVTNGPGSTAMFTVNTNLFLTWFWQTENQLTVSAGTGGTVDTNALNEWYPEGASVTNIVAVPSNGYYFVNWSGDVSSGNETMNPLSEYMTQPRDIQANFAPTMWFVSAMAGMHGTISPMSMVPVPNGGSTNFIVTPDPGFHILDVALDGVSLGPLPSVLLSNVTTNHTLLASFAGNIDSVTPNNGPLAGGTTVTIQGPLLGVSLDVTNVTLCGVPASILGQNPTQVVVTAGASAVAGPGDVAVYSLSMGMSQHPNGYTYNAAGRIFGTQYVWTERQPAGPFAEMWRSVASSADGSHLIACVYSGRLYTSADYGVTWQERQPAGNISRQWFAVASSGSGQRLYAGIFGGRLYSSADFGNTWVERQPAGPVDLFWHASAASADGLTFMIGVANTPGGRLYTTADGGVNWVERQPAGNTNRTWGAAAMSADGMNLLAGVDGQRLYTSPNGGVNWVERQPVGAVDLSWRLSASSADGTNLFAGTAYASGRLYSSGNGGATWVERQPAGNVNLDWRTVGCSGDGRRVLAAVFSGRAYLSVDGGATWREERPAGNVNGGWWACAASADGYQFIIADGFNRLYTGVAVGGVTPAFGPMSGSNVVTIAGSGLGDGTDVTGVTLCGVPVLTILSQSPTQVVVRAGATGVAGLGNVVVASTSRGTVTASNAYAYSLAAPQNLAATDGAYTNKVSLTWDPAGGATGYGVWRGTTTNLAGAVHISAGADPATNRYDDITVTPNQVYYYWVWSLLGTNQQAVSGYDGGFALQGVSQIFYEGWGTNGVRNIYRCREDGSGETPVFTDGNYRFRPSVSPNGTQMAYGLWQGATCFVCVATIDGQNERKIALSTQQYGIGSVNWHPNGTNLVYVERSNNAARDGWLYRVNADGTGRVLLPPTTDYDKHYAHFSPDGGTICFARNETPWFAFPQNLFFVDADGGNERKMTIHVSGEDQKVFVCHFSPDGRKVVYQLGWSFLGNSSIWVINADGSGDTMIIDTAFSNEDPVFTRDGAKILFTRYAAGHWQLATCNPDGTNVQLLPLSAQLDRGYPCQAIASGALLAGGCISCVIQPPAVVASGAQWRLTSGPDTNWHGSGQASAQVPRVPYTVTFQGVSGWTTPADITGVVPPAGGTSTVFATYAPVNMALIPIQTYQMGIYMGQGGHAVTVSDFYLDRQEVTVRDYQAFCAATGSTMPAAPAWGWTDANLPMVNVTWNEAAAYAAWMGKRLPTEAEFECAMRDTLSDRRYPCGDAMTTNEANYGNCVGRPTVAGWCAATANYQLYDIAGNVWEWCSDWYADVLTGPVTDPVGPASGSNKVIRGGSWVNPAARLRCASRFQMQPFVRYADLGFRCAAAAGPTGALVDGDRNKNGISDWWEIWRLGTNAVYGGTGGGSGGGGSGGGESSGSAPRLNDFDGDGTSDLVVLDGAGNWYMRNLAGQVLGWDIPWGWAGAMPVPGDFDGDGASDLAVFDAGSGDWYVRAVAGQVIGWSIPWGWPGAMPVPGDYDGDGASDLAVFDGASGNWYMRDLAGKVLGWSIPWGWAGAVPVPGDYDGDGKSDLAVFDAGSGNWYVRIVAGQVIGWSIPWGWSGAIPVPGDYDGDGASDLAVFDAATGDWYIRTVAGHVLAWGVPWGWAGAIPVPGDYDGDGKSDLAVFDVNTGDWYIRTAAGQVLAWGVPWGWRDAPPAVDTLLYRVKTRH